MRTSPMPSPTICMPVTSPSARAGRGESSTWALTAQATCWRWVVERDDGTELAIHALRMRKRYEALLPRSQEHDDG